jgi:hypothetical protein
MPVSAFDGDCTQARVDRFGSRELFDAAQGKCAQVQRSLTASALMGPEQIARLIGPFRAAVASATILTVRDRDFFHTPARQNPRLGQGLPPFH